MWVAAHNHATRKLQMWAHILRVDMLGSWQASWAALQLESRADTGSTAMLMTYLTSDLKDHEIKLSAEKQNPAVELVLVPMNVAQVQVGISLRVL
jgi:hypothetical protein